MMTTRSAHAMRATSPRANHFEERPAKMRPPVAPRSTRQSNGSTMRRASASLSWGMALVMRSCTLACCETPGRMSWLRLPSFASRSVRARRVAR